MLDWHRIQASEWCIVANLFVNEFLYYLSEVASNGINQLILSTMFVIMHYATSHAHLTECTQRANTI